MSMLAFYPRGSLAARPREVSGRPAGKDSDMLIRWVFRFVALFLGRKAWESYQRRRDSRPGARV
jgi:hypothetical protein